MDHPKMKYVYVGIDSHKDTNTAVVLNCFFEKLGEITFNNTPNSFEDFFNQVKKLKLKGTSLAFGLEDVSAYGRHLAIFLLGKKQIVKHVNAGLVAHERKSLNLLHKTDSVDSECASRVLLSRFDTLPDVDPQDKYWVLQNLVVRRRSIVKINTNLKNHLHSFITSHYPSYSKFFSNIDCNSSLAFFEKYPSPSLLKDVDVKDLEDLLRIASEQTQYKGKAEKILDLVAKDGDTTIQYQDIRNNAIVSTVRQINFNLKEIEIIDSLTREFLNTFPYKLQSMKGIDIITASNLICEIGDITKFPTPSKLARYSGVAPVTYSSGKTDIQYSNQRGNRVLNKIFYHLAVLVTITAGKNKKIVNPFFYNYYQKKLSEGKTKGQALKCVQRRLVNIIWRMMTHNEEYINPPSEDYKDEADLKKADKK